MLLRTDVLTKEFLKGDFDLGIKFAAKTEENKKKYENALRFCGFATALKGETEKYRKKLSKGLGIESIHNVTHISSKEQEKVYQCLYQFLSNKDWIFSGKYSGLNNEIKSLLSKIGGLLEKKDFEVAPIDGNRDVVSEEYVYSTAFNILNGLLELVYDCYKYSDNFIDVDLTLNYRKLFKDMEDASYDEILVTLLNEKENDVNIKVYKVLYEALSDYAAVLNLHNFTQDYLEDTYIRSIDDINKRLDGLYNDIVEFLISVLRTFRRAGYKKSDYRTSDRDALMEIKKTVDDSNAENPFEKAYGKSVEASYREVLSDIFSKSDETTPFRGDEEFYSEAAYLLAQLLKNNKIENDSTEEFIRQVITFFSKKSAVVQDKLIELYKNDDLEENDGFQTIRLALIRADKVDSSTFYSAEEKEEFLEDWYFAKINE